MDHLCNGHLLSTYYELLFWLFSCEHNTYAHFILTKYVFILGALASFDWAISINYFRSTSKYAFIIYLSF